MIFRYALMLDIGEDERIETNDGYVEETPKYMKCLKRITEDGERETI